MVSSDVELKESRVRFVRSSFVLESLAVENGAVGVFLVVSLWALLDGPLNGGCGCVCT